MLSASEQPLAAALDRRWQEYRLRFKACRLQPSEVAVHDLRVAARRLLATQDIIRALDPQPRIRKTRRALKGLLDNLDEIRDVQVMLVKVREVPEHGAILGSFRAELEKRERRLLRRTRKTMQDSKPSKLRKWINKTKDRTTTEMQREGHVEAVFRAIDGLYLRAADLSRQIDARQPTTLHRARIAFKRFRYAAEVVERSWPELPEDHFKRMHDYQRCMGDIRDLEIVRGALLDFSKHMDAATTSDAEALELEAIAHAYEECQRQIMAEFREKQVELGTFWRAAPNVPFPWEGAAQ